MKTLRVTLTGGGTGGHVLPALAVARSFGHVQSDVRVELSWIGSGSPERELATAEGIPFHRVPSGKLRRYFSLANVVDPLRIAAGTARAWWLLGRIRPHVVFSKGGFVAVPVGLAARLRGIPLVTHESDATPGLATRILARGAARILLGTPGDTAWTTRPTTVVGNPVRSALRDGVAERARRRFGLRAGRPVVLVLGGSGGAHAVNELVVAAGPTLLERAEILHQTGAGKATALAAPGYVQREFLDEAELADALTAADVVVSRAGASAIAELALVAATAVLIPLPRSASRGDQIANAAGLAAAGAAVVLDQDTLDAATLASTVTTLLADAQRCAELSRALARFARPDAADDIARAVLEVGLALRSA